MGLESDAASAGKGFVGEGFNTLSQTKLFFTDAGRIRLSWCMRMWVKWTLNKFE